jgi:hypothetical protein
VYREQPPRRPCPIPEQVVEVEGAPIAPPARRVVFEKFSNLPQKPQNVLIEKWLPYRPQRRRVVFQRSCRPTPPNPRNTIIEWEAPDVEVEKVCRELGVVDADPEEYVRRYGPELKRREDIPNLCPSCPPRQPTPAPAPAPAPQQCGCQYQQEQQEESYAQSAQQWEAPEQSASPALQQSTSFAIRPASAIRVSRAASAARAPSASFGSASASIAGLEGDVDALR